MKMDKDIKSFFGIIAIGFYLSLYQCNAFAATTCSAAFPDVLQANKAGAKATLNCQVNSINPNGGSTVLPFAGLNGGACGVNNCTSAPCTASGSIAAPGAALSGLTYTGSTGADGNMTLSGTVTFDNSPCCNTHSNWGTVTISANANVTFSNHSPAPAAALYRIKTLVIGNNSTVNFPAGDYWIDTLTPPTAGNTATVNFISTAGPSTARFYFKNAVTFNGNVSWNTTGSASQMFFYAFNNLTINDSDINAVMYAVGNVVLGNGTTSPIITGAISSNNLTTKAGVNIATYDANAVNLLDFGAICPNVVGQFIVNTPANATNCQPATVQVTAETSAGAVVTQYIGTIALDTQQGTGTWSLASGSGTFTSGGNNGLATYQYSLADLGVASFNLTYATGPSPVTIKVSSGSVVSFSNPINYIPTNTGLLVTATSVPALPSPPPVAFNTTQTAGTNSGNIILTAYDANTCGIIPSYTGVKNIRFWTNYINPTSGTINATINGTTIASSSGAAATSQNITFTNGVANVILKYNDVGQLSLNVKDTVTPTITGASGNFVIIPANYVINVPSAHPISQTTSPAAAALSACLADFPFTTAGQGFTVNVQPVTSGGAPTPNYGNETPTAQGLTLQSSALVAPTGANSRNGSSCAIGSGSCIGTIGNASAFSRTTGTGVPFTGLYFTGSTFSFDEVGCINLTVGATNGTYLGAAVAATASTVVGRFTPNHFSAAGNSPSFGTGCASGGFTYLDQPITYSTAPILTVTAQAVANTTTINYNSSFWKLGSSFNPVYNKGYYLIDALAPAVTLNLASPNATATPTDNLNGTTTVNFSTGTGFQIVRQSGVLVSPFNAEIQLNIPSIVDTDSIACTTGCTAGAFAFGTTASGGGIPFTGVGGGKTFLHGRLVLFDSISSQIAQNTMTMQVQKYTTQSGNAVGFVVNTADSACTSLTTTNLSLTPSATISPTPTPTITSTFFSQQGGGVNTITFPATNQTGYVDVRALLSAGASPNANLPWLQYSWQTGGAFTGDPIGRASFGIYQGNDRVIYQQENYQ